MVFATIVLFVLTLAVNEWLFRHFEFVPGINWVYLPAGIRLLSTLLFGAAGAVGLLIASLLVNVFYIFPDDFARAFMGAILASVAPYLVYRVARQAFGLRASLTNLTPGRLLACVLAYSVASPLLHHIWFALRGNRGGLFHGFLVMFVGDLTGTLIVVYAMRALLGLLPARAVGARAQSR
ncbi:hypothetical protein ACKI2N_024800 [Cupriavidus sp. 30B13]|uniref:hypothetical protein n=1 Tax=Cupriavidus sp. 30B13 TaxID=3384241 RepID=UPI003B8F4212